MSSGSQTSLSQRDQLSQEDTASSGSRRSSVDLPDDKDRLATLDSAIRWIKDELAEIRDRDKTILNYLHEAQSNIRSIHQQQQQRLKVQHDVEKRHLFGSTEDLNNGSDSLTASSNSYSNTLGPNFSRTFISSGALCTSPTMQKPICLESSADDDLLSSFLGEDNVGKLKSLSQLPAIQLNDQSPPTDSSAEIHKRNMAGVKKEARKSAVSQMQMLRKQLQEETKMDLDNFDKEFDTPKVLAVADETKSYRYSILNRMDEILNHKVKGEACHVRQYSEPVMMGSMSEWMLSSRRGSDNCNGSSIPSSNQSRNQSKPGSFQYPNSGMTRSGSAGFGKSGNKPNHSTHYDTTVVGKRKSRPSSRDSTLERKKNPSLQYSVESLEEDKVGDHYHVHNGQGVNNGEVDSSKQNFVPRTQNGHVKPKVPHLRNVPHHHHSPSNSDSTSPEIHPETSPVSPLANGVVDPLMTTTQALEEYMRQGGEKGADHRFTHAPHSEMKRSFNSPASAPLTRRNVLKTKDTWL